MTKSTPNSQTNLPTCPWKPTLISNYPSALFPSALLRSTILLHIWPAGLCSRQALQIGLFYPAQERPPPKRPPTCWCPLESPGLSCASCPAQSGPWQGGASLWNHTSQLFALGSRHPTPLPSLCSAPTPPHPASILHRMSMAPFWRKKKKGEKERDPQKLGNNCTMGVFYWVWGFSQNSSYQRGHESQLKPRLSFIPVRFLRFTPVSHLQHMKKWQSI